MTHSPSLGASSVEQLTTEAIRTVEAAVQSVERLSKERSEQKLSVNRTNGVARELKELRKVLALVPVA